ncbi:hypothetical protein CLV63_103166 [Murinocardiopsis flavida]|uniref:Uncharacterized protein n=1 Tax=Murinocardiopsis flavida TaxID=645275 RepID=A0A2P8DQF5_9ACTN|nr:hypothetical protein CLV63_103166 [Murinocardiopsis flavida]
MIAAWAVRYPAAQRPTASRDAPVGTDPHLPPPNS